MLSFLKEKKNHIAETKEIKEHLASISNNLEDLSAISKLKLTKEARMQIFDTLEEVANKILQFDNNSAKQLDNIANVLSKYL